MKQILSKEAKIGLVTIISLVLLYFGINFFERRQPFQTSQSL